MSVRRDTLDDVETDVQAVGRDSLAHSLGISALRVGMPGAVPETSASSQRIGVRVRRCPCHLNA
ncbi:hypothetical protein XFF6992_260022 [Xanthomonas citri pv. fuscans]|nr:hypothetical protein XFF6992_190022 [Xanthomonas citri pv. fuscans]SOO18714.1 hypothetical protein XFF6992_260022 [Xanthomonas citri pv. fuscans]SOO32697.1 hypothetical protein XFF6994_2250002 [Xanthomonas citri pv. fuscans]